jgi:hypothetical protein
MKPGTICIMPVISKNAFLAILMWWLGGKVRLSAEELNGLYRRFAISAVKSGLRP